MQTTAILPARPARRLAGEGKLAMGVAFSENGKIGKASATMAGQGSCPSRCPLRNAGCYAENGPQGFITRRLNLAGDGSSLVEIAQAEADAIDQIWSGLPLRIHVVGDCSSNEAARIVSAAAERYMARNHAPAWTYTHAWDEPDAEAKARGEEMVHRPSWGSVSVLASCESTDDVRLAHARGYAAALVVPEFPSRRRYEQDGIQVIPCPAQTTKGVTCSSCRLCFGDTKLGTKVIGFEAHGNGTKKVRAMLEMVS